MTYDTAANSQHNNQKEIWDKIFNDIQPDARTLIADHIAAYSWNCLRAIPTLINPPGPPRKPKIDNNTGDLLFRKNKTESVGVVFRLPHTYVPGAPVSSHVHWVREREGNVYWQYKYKVVPVLHNVPETTDTAESKVSIGEAQWLSNSPRNPMHDVSLLEQIPMAEYSDIGPVTVGVMVVGILSRLGRHGNDTYNADVRFWQFDAHHLAIEHGSFIEGQKGISFDV